MSVPSKTDLSDLRTDPVVRSFHVPTLDLHPDVTDRRRVSVGNRTGSTTYTHVSLGVLVLRYVPFQVLTGYGPYNQWGRVLPRTNSLYISTDTHVCNYISVGGRVSVISRWFIGIGFKGELSGDWTSLSEG